MLFHHIVLCLYLFVQDTPIKSSKKNAQKTKLKYLKSPTYISNEMILTTDTNIQELGDSTDKHDNEQVMLIEDVYEVTHTISYLIR
jgi:hypothetical protein